MVSTTEITYENSRWSAISLTEVQKLQQEGDSAVHQSHSSLDHIPESNNDA